MCVDLCVSLYTSALSLRHVCVQPGFYFYLRLTCGPRSRHPEAWNQTSDLFLSLPDDSADRSPPVPPQAGLLLFLLQPSQQQRIPPSHDSLSVVTQQPASHHIQLQFVYVCVPFSGRTTQTSIFQLFFSRSSWKIMDSRKRRRTHWAFPPHSSSAITELTVQPFSPFAVILLSSLQCSLRFLTNCLFSHLNTPAPPPRSASPCKLLLSGTGRREAERKTAFLFVSQCNYVG